jgi:hypothetical protein
MTSVSSEDLILVLPPQGVTGTEISIDHAIYKGDAVSGFAIPARHVHRLLELGWTLKKAFDFAALIARIDALTLKVENLVADMKGGQ